MTKKYYASLLDACNAVAVEPISEFSLIPNRWIRGNTLKTNGKSDASFMMFADGQGGIVKNFQTGECAVWKRRGNNSEELSPDLRVKMMHQHDAYAKQQREDQICKAQEARAFFKACDKVRGSHPYLKAKGLKQPIWGIRMTSPEHFEDVFNYRPKGPKGMLLDPLLVIPIRGWLTGSLGIQTFQLIDSKGQKYFLYGGKKKGAFWQSQKFPKERTAKPILVLGEGLATVMSVVQHSTLPCIGIMVCDCGNFMAVAQQLRAKFPLAKMIILSDVGNGEKQAENAAKAVGAILQKPTFSDQEIELFKQKFNDRSPSDWNDFYLIQDLNEDAEND